MIIETSANQLYFVVESPISTHCWDGLRVKRVKGGFVVVKNAKPELIRKEATRFVADFSALKGAA